jgi:glycosyltransferase involved in cell wall biosynthesis
MTKLSMVVPCYNCEATLEDAVASIFRQDPIFPIDITMVDDGSADSTYEVMQRLARQDRRIKVLRHKSNCGGGAARNTAVEHTDGDLIFCLDSDDMLGPGFLENMTRFWDKKKCDGLGMSTSIKFKGRNIKNVAYVTEFERPGRRVRFESFLEGSRCSLGVVFLITRAAFNLVGGYPTEHGFDTQGMAFRFLCHGLTAYTCPESTYYHRVELPQSYYMREQRTGRVNWNWFNVLDEFLYLFKDAIQVKLLRHNLFDMPGRTAPDDLLKIVAGRTDIYVSDYKHLIREGPEGVARESEGSEDANRQYWLGNFHRSKGRHSKALTHYSRALALGFDYRIIYYRMLQTELSLAGSDMQPKESLDELVLYSRPFPLSQRRFRQRIFHSMLASRRWRGLAMTLKLLWDRLRGGKRR